MRKEETPQTQKPEPQPQGGKKKKGILNDVTSALRLIHITLLELHGKLESQHPRQQN